MSYYGARSRMARLAIQKLENDKRLSETDKSKWYEMFNLHELGLDLSYKFLKLAQDDETQEFIENSTERSEWFFTQMIQSMILSFLKIFMASTSVNGLLQRGSMFVFSTAQFRALIEFDTSFSSVKMNSLLDLGAGDGATTLKMAPLFQNVYATEMSYTMQWRLQQKGFTVLDVEKWDQVVNSSFSQQETSARISLDNVESNVLNLDSNKYIKYDVVSCLNLLDRCELPLTFLAKIRNALKPNGRLVVALVLPFKPYVEYSKEHRPKEFLFDANFSHDQACSSSASYQQPCANNNFGMSKVNRQIKYLIEHVFDPLGFELVKFTKLPYLCEGNIEQAYYFMTDYVFVFKLK